MDLEQFQWTVTVYSKGITLSFSLLSYPYYIILWLQRGQTGHPIWIRPWGMWAQPFINALLHRATSFPIYKCPLYRAWVFQIYLIFLTHQLRSHQQVQHYHFTQEIFSPSWMCHKNALPFSFEDIWCSIVLWFDQEIFHSHTYIGHLFFLWYTDHQSRNCR